MKKEKDMTIADHIKNFDFYKDLPRDLQEPSVSGASGNFIAILRLYCSFPIRDVSHGNTVYYTHYQVHGVQENK
jgi:hypothetical protein